MTALASFYTPARFHDQGGRFGSMPWGGRVIAWGEHQGLRIATDVEVGWYEDGVFVPFYRGRVTNAEYECGPP